MKSILVVISTFILVLTTQLTVAQTGNFVIVHGAWGGAWQFKKTAEELTKFGNTVYRPTLTGLGERYHLADSTIGLSTHVQDVINTILFEDLKDIILVGHSYGGMVITAVADSIPDRIKKIVYLDAFFPEDGESVADFIFKDQRGKGMLNYLELGFIKPSWVKDTTKVPRDVPHPVRTMMDHITLKKETRKLIPTTYILTYAGDDITKDDFYFFYQRAKKKNVKMIEMVADHNPQIKKLKELVYLLHHEN